MSAPTPNREYRDGLRGARRCRDCEAPMLASEADFSRCAPCRAKRNVRRAVRRGDSPEALARAHARVREAIAERARITGGDGAGSREAVRGSGPGRRRAADRVEVRVRLSRELHRRILADAADRGESVEAWIAAEAREALDAAPEGET